MFSAEIVEKMAALEHEQWMAWSRTIVETEEITKERVMRWEKFWIPYKDLTEEYKEYDRVWARKALKTIGEEK